MTPVILLKELKKFIEKTVKDIILPVRPVKNKTLPQPRPKGKAVEDATEEITNRAAEVHLQRLPDKDAETQRIPYVLLQLLTGKDEHIPGEQPESECKIRVIVATYSENDSEGSLDTINIITRIRIALLKAGVIGEQFLVRQPLEWYVYPDDTQPFFFAEIILLFEMPSIIREIHTHYMDE